MSEFVSNPNFYTEKSKDFSISKSNTLIEAGFDLTLAEHDLMTLAINKLHKQGTGNHNVFTTAKEFAIANKISESHAYQQLKATADKLMERHLKFPLYIDLDKKQNKEPNFVCVVPPKHGRYETVPTRHNWLQSVGYMDSDGFIYLLFTDPIRFLIDRTGDAYTTYNFTNTIEMKSFSGKRLYEMVCKWKDLGKTKMMYIDEWKEFFGVLDKYSKTAEFKRWILLPAIAEVNAQGDFRISLQQEKVGRNITHFQILIKKNKIENPTKCTKTIDLFEKPKDTFIRMSDSQLDKFASKLADLGEVQKMANVGEDMKPFIARLRNMLKDKEKQKILVPYLSQTGFK
ncbi:replication initiation protein, partial [Acinetobacter sp. B5B]|uniref:replication initiation protein n=1 Tax=Acinetobacter baretiae TaxID=2605383 RepID=UPI0018C1FE88